MNTNNGFTLIEVMIAFSIFLVSILAIWQLMGYASRKSRTVHSMTEAVYLAEEKIEAIKTGAESYSGSENCSITEDCLVSWNSTEREIAGLDFKEIMVEVKWNGHKVNIINLAQ